MGLLDFTQDLYDAAAGTLPLKVEGPDGKRRRRLRVQVYKNEFIEKYFAQAHPITPGIWFGPFVIWGLYDGFVGTMGSAGHGIGLTLGLFALGVLITTFIEYSLHRWIFHFEPTSSRGRLNAFLLHGYHHDFPNDPMRLVLPPIGIWPVALIVGTIYFFAFGPYWLQLFAGTAAGYIAYDWVHYYTHHANPKGGIGKWLKRYHMLHHHDSPNHRYGITTPLWDLLFGTFLSNRKLVREAGRHQES